MSDLVGNPEDRFSHNEAHILMDIHSKVVSFIQKVKRKQRLGNGTIRTKILSLKPKCLKLKLQLDIIHRQHTAAISKKVATQLPLPYLINLNFAKTRCCYGCLCQKFVILVISRFGFEGWIWVLITSVPDLCILFTFLFTHKAVIYPLEKARKLDWTVMVANMEVINPDMFIDRDKETVYAMTSFKVS